MVNSHSWSTQRTAQESPVPTPSELYSNILIADSLKKRAYLAVSYLTLGRVSEIVGNKAKGYPPWTRTDWEEIKTKDNKPCILLTLYNEKNKKVKIKKIPVPIWHEQEAKFWDMIKIYLDQNEGEIPFDFTRQRAGQISREVLGFNTHFLRHIRVTHLRNIYGFDPIEIQILAGWTDTRPLTHYDETKYWDVMEKF